MLDKLPDDLLINILSFMPTMDAMKTSLLGRRWRKLWTYTRNINIRLHPHQQHPSDVVRFLSLFQSSKVYKFQVEFPFNNQTRKRVEPFIDFALHHQVEDLTYLFATNFLRPPDIIPSKIFTVNSLVVLKLVYYEIEVPQSLSLPLLRTLVLERLTYSSELNAEAEELLISNCPSLETLHIKEFENCRDIFCISSTNLRSLYTDVSCLLRFITPALMFLEMRDNFLYGPEALESIVFGDISSLDTCVLDTHCEWVLAKFSLWTILSNLGHVKSLHINLNDGYIRILSTFPPWQVSLNCTSLKLRISLASMNELRAMGNLFHSSPRIQKLTLIVQEDFFHVLSSKRWNLLIKSFQGMNQLKEVEILYGFYNVKATTSRQRDRWRDATKNAFTHRVELVKLIYKHTKNLEILTIGLQKSFDEAPPNLRKELELGLRNIHSRARKLPRAIIKIVHEK